MNIDTLAKMTGEIDSPTPERLAAGRHQLDVAIHAADVRVTAVLRRRRRRRRGVSALAGAAAAAATALFAVPLFSAVPASAEEVLLAAADAAGQQVDEAAGAAYWHVTSEVDYPNTEPFRREIWLSRSGQSVLRDEALAAEAALLTGGGPLDPALVYTEELGTPSIFVVGTEPLTWDELENLPTDSRSLKEFLSEKVRDEPAGYDNALWEAVTGLLRESPASPALRRALWEVAASIPDVELLGSMTDSVGRVGVAIERNQLDQGWYRVVYILDPNDGTLLETRNIDGDGTITWRQTQISEEASTTAPAAQPYRAILSELLSPENS